MNAPAYISEQHSIAHPFTACGQTLCKHLCFGSTTFKSCAVKALVALSSHKCILLFDNDNWHCCVYWHGPVTALCCWPHMIQRPTYSAPAYANKTSRHHMPHIYSSVTRLDVWPCFALDVIYSCLLALAPCQHCTGTSKIRPACSLVESKSCQLLSRNSIHPSTVTSGKKKNACHFDVTSRFLEVQ